MAYDRLSACMRDKPSDVRKQLQTDAAKDKDET
jgi:hypothetical protein